MSVRSLYWQTLGIAIALVCPIRAAERPPNIVFFLVDDLGWSDVGCYGSPFYDTPNIDRLASEGVRFTQAYATCHVCSPTRASILTGKYPARLHLTDWLQGRKDYDFQELAPPKTVSHLPFAETTLAEALKAHGYYTAIFGKWHLGEAPSGPNAHGFDVHVPQNWYKGWPKAGYHAPFKFEGLADSPGDYLTDRLTDEAIRYIEEQHERPFFLYFSHFAVHDPIHGRPDLVAKYSKKLAAMHRPTGPKFILEGNPDDSTPLTQDELRTLITQPSHSGYKLLPQRTVKIKQHQDNVEFAAMVEAIDESLGRVMAQLEALELSNDTIIIFTADNGGMSAGNFGNPKRVIDTGELNKAYATSNLPLRGAKGWLYEGGIRVPTIVKWPGQGQAGVECHEPIVSTDFFPSLLHMVELPALPNQTIDGVNVAPLLKGEPFDRGPIYWHFPHYSNHGMQSPGGAIRIGDHKLLDYFENDSVQLFDLAKDPGERQDLATATPELAATLHTKLKTWREQVGAEMMPKK